MPSMPQPTIGLGDRVEHAFYKESEEETDEEMQAVTEESTWEDWEETDAIMMDVSFHDSLEIAPPAGLDKVGHCGGNLSFEN